MEIPTKNCYCPDPCQEEIEDLTICSKCWGLNPKIQIKKKGGKKK